MAEGGEFGPEAGEGVRHRLWGSSGVWAIGYIRSGRGARPLPLCEGGRGGGPPPILASRKSIAAMSSNGDSGRQHREALPLDFENLVSASGNPT